MQTKAVALVLFACTALTLGDVQVAPPEFLQSSNASTFRRLAASPFEITPCDPLNKAACPAGGCGNVAGYECYAPGWVFCQNAVCDPVPFADSNGKLVAKCHCWQQTDPGVTPAGSEPTKFSILPVETNSGANCVLGDAKGGKPMCDAMVAGALWSTYGPTGKYYPGKPMKAAVCKPHTQWAWCWGAPCFKDTSVGAPTPLFCHCPMMISMNNANQLVSLAGDAQCPPTDPDPCSTDQIHNSMPAGTSPSGFMPSSAADTCYNGADPCWKPSTGRLFDGELGQFTIANGSIIGMLSIGAFAALGGVAFMIRMRKYRLVPADDDADVQASQSRLSLTRNEGD